MFTAGSYGRPYKAKTERQPGFLYLAVRQTESPLDGVRIPPKKGCFLYNRDWIKCASA